MQEFIAKKREIFLMHVRQPARLLALARTRAPRTLRAIISAARVR